MKRKDILLIVLIIFLTIALIIMTILYLNAMKNSKNNLDNTLAVAEENRKANVKIEELESELENLKNKKIIVDTNTFYAEIKEIIEKNEKVTLLVDGLDVNNINNRGEFYITIDKKVELVWQGVNLDMSELKVGQNISITHDGGVQETAPARIPNVYIVELLDDNK